MSQESFAMFGHCLGSDRSGVMAHIWCLCSLLFAIALTGSLEPWLVTHLRAPGLGMSQGSHDDMLPERMDTNRHPVDRNLGGCPKFHPDLHL